MHYVYELSYNNIVFYIGVTNNPYQRYKQHTGCHEYQTHKIIFWLRHFGCYPDFRLVAHFNDKDTAYAKEKDIIRQYAIKKHKLCNTDCNDKDNFLYLPNIPINRTSPNKNFIKRLSNDDTIHIKHYIDGYNSKL